MIPDHRPFPDARAGAVAALAAVAAVLGLGAGVGCGDVNQPPSAALVAPQVVFAGEQLAVDLEGSDPDGDALAWSVGGLPDGAEVITQTRSTAVLLWGTAAKDAIAGGRVYRATVIADDGRGGRAETAFDVTVIPPYGAPTFDLPGGVVLNLAEDQELQVFVEVDDDDSTSVEISLTEAPDGAKLSKSGVKSAWLYWAPSEAQRLDTVHRVVMTAVDEAGQGTNHTLLVVLVNAGSQTQCAGGAPKVEHDSLPDINVSTSKIPLTVSASDADSTVDSVTLYVSESPPGADTFETIALVRSDPTADEWLGEIDPAAVPATGKLLHYYLEARDNDDPVGVDCDHVTRVPKTGHLTFGLYPPSAPSWACIDDDAEPDDAGGLAPTLGPGVYSGRRLCGGSPDVVRVIADDTRADANGAVLTARVTRVPSHGPVNVVLRNEGGTVLDSASDPDAYDLVVSGAWTGSAWQIEMSSPDDEVRLSYELEIQIAQTPCEPDALEPNDSAMAATSLEAGSWDELELCGADEDWFRFDLAAGERLDLAITFQHGLGDLDLELWDAAGGTKLLTAASESSEEALSWIATGQTAVTARVLGYQGADNVYALSAAVVDAAGGTGCIEDLLGVHQTAGTAPVLFSGLYQNLSACPDSPDWYAVDLNGGETVEVLVEPQTSGGAPLDVKMYTNPEGAPLSVATIDADGLQSLKGTIATESRVWYRVASTSAMTYAMYQVVTDPPGPCQPDRHEPNDGIAPATELEPGVQTQLRLCGMEDVDGFRVAVQAFQTLTVLTRHDTGKGFTDVEVIAPDWSTPVAEQLDYADGVALEVLVEAEGLYTILVRPYGVESLPYDLSIGVK